MSIFGSLFSPDPRSLAREIVMEQRKLNYQEKREAHLREQAFELQKANPGSIGAKYSPEKGWEPIFKTNKGEIK